MMWYFLRQPGYLAAAVLCWTSVPVSAANQVVVVPMTGRVAGGVAHVATVTSAGQVWMARNLGARRVATAYNDAEAYGSLYQWGRGGDGHQYRASPATTSLSSGDSPGHGQFILGENADSDWRSSPNDGLWQGVDGINNPCPAGFRLPTLTEWETERLSWTSNNRDGAYASPLKLVVGGSRMPHTGELYQVGRAGSYWSSTVNDTGQAYNLYFVLNNYGGNAYLGDTGRARGCSVRCIKD